VDALRLSDRPVCLRYSPDHVRLICRRCVIRTSSPSVGQPVREELTLSAATDQFADWVVISHLRLATRWAQSVGGQRLAISERFVDGYVSFVACDVRVRAAR
jgi:hypothetical protein